MKEQTIPDLDFSSIFDASSQLNEIFSFAIHFMLITVGAFLVVKISFVLFKMFQRTIDRGGRVEYLEPKPAAPEEPVTRANGGYFVKTPGGERVFVSDAEIYPNDPDIADRSRVRGKWSSNARSESIPDRSGTDLMTGLIIGSAVSSAIESSSSSHSNHSNSHSNHSSSHNSYDSHSSSHSYTDYSSGSYGSDSGSGGGMDF